MHKNAQQISQYSNKKNRLQMTEFYMSEAYWSLDIVNVWCNIYFSHMA